MDPGGPNIVDDSTMVYVFSRENTVMGNTFRQFDVAEAPAKKIKQVNVNNKLWISWFLALNVQGILHRQRHLSEVLESISDEQGLETSEAVEGTDGFWRFLDVFG